MPDAHRPTVNLTVILFVLLVAPGTSRQETSAAQQKTAAGQPKAGASQMKTADHGVFPPGSFEWQPGPPSLATGSKFAVLEGDPSKEGLFTMRLRFPDGFEVKPHWHPAVEHVTVMSGTFNLGMGETFDKASTKALAPGTFVFMPPKMNHFAWAKGDTVVQLHGVGPWQVNYIDPADDPRKKQ